MRVLEVDAGREWRGGQNQVRLLCRELADEPEVELRLLTRRGGELARRAAAAGVQVVGVPWRWGLDPRAAWGVAAAVRRFRPAVVHAHDAHALRLARAALAWAGGPRPPLVASRRVDFHVRPGGQWHRADRIIAVSHAVRRVLEADGVPPERIVVVHDGIDPAEVRRAEAGAGAARAALGLPPGARLAVNVAALVPHKDQRTLLHAAAAARARAPELHWVLAGEGPLRPALEAEIARLGLADRVRLLGWVPQADALIAAADVLVMSSREEGLGSVVLDALALGRPVVATRAGGLAEVVPAEWLVPVGNAPALAERVLAALAAPPQPALPPEFTARAMAKATLAVYRSIA